MSFVFKDIQSNFLLRRLHSLSGIVPIGGFLIFHLFANSVAIENPEGYNFIINFLRSLPFVEFIEIAVLGLPIAFHALYGILIYTTAKPNQFQYSHAENWRYIIQRASGMIALVYIIYHVWQFKFVEHLDYNYVAKSLAGTQEIGFLPEIPFINPFSIYAFYLISLISINYHFANGIWSFCITWGITVGEKAQRMTSWLAVLVFAALTYIGVETINSLAEAGQHL